MINFQIQNYTRKILKIIFPDTMNSVQIDTQIKRVQIPTKSYDGQKPGTSGLRKKVTVFQQLNYTNNFIQSYFNALRKDALSPKCTLLIGGDGRYYTEQCIEIICRIACANGIDELHIAKNGLMSTPACSAYIRKQNKQIGNCIGGILLTASHNPGGPTQDFGIKFNSRNGGPAQEQFTNSVYHETTTVTEIHSVQYNFLKKLHADAPVDLSQVAQYHFTNVTRPSKKLFVVKVVENVAHYVSLMKELFDFQAINQLFQRPDFSFVFDGMYGAAGPYAIALFKNQITKGNITLLNCQPQPDFHGHHPDPNLVCAKELVDLMGLGEKHQSTFSLGAACDGDADRNMIIGNKFFVTPSDLLGLLAANWKLFLKQQPHGIARSMPTSGSVDMVCKKLGLKVYETPTGWKFFGNLMEEGLISLCGEESFGTGSSHIRQKDGLWTILAMLQILGKINENTKHGEFKGVSEIVHQFWKSYGRNYYCRYDYENIEVSAGQKVWSSIQAKVKEYKQGKVKGDVFEYKDPVDKSFSGNQGLRFSYEDGSRVVFRQSGTGSVGMTIRMYFQKYDTKEVSLSTSEALKDLIEFGLTVSQIQTITGMKKPSVIT